VKNSLLNFDKFHTTILHTYHTVRREAPLSGDELAGVDL
jgi:hypothetical protein